MKKKYITPKVETIVYQTEGIMAGSPSKDPTQNVPDQEPTSIPSTGNADGQTSKNHAWESWD